MEKRIMGRISYIRLKNAINNITLINADAQPEAAGEKEKDEF